jgi:hypothetical protein
MTDDQQVSVSQEIIDLRDVTLRIPGECFFCDVIDLDVKVLDEKQFDSDLESELNLVRDKLSEPGFSPYPEEQLSWGYHVCEVTKRAFIFATPVARLKQLGWQNLEVFRRVFPSFVSCFCKAYETETTLFLLAEETLSLAYFKTGTTVPEFIYSLPVDPTDYNSIEKVKAELILLTQNDQFGFSGDILLADKIIRTQDDRFEFYHFSSSEDKKPDSEPIKYDLSADLLWKHDLRPSDFKIAEKKRRSAVRSRWKLLKFCLALLLLLGTSFAGVKFCINRVELMGAEVEEMSRQVPLVVKARELLHKLKQQKLGGIDPFGSIGRLAAHRGGTLDEPHIWFTNASFDSRNEIKLEGHGRNVAAINTFIGKLESLDVAKIRLGRSGDEMRKIKSGGGETTFEIQLQMFEQKKSDLGN